MGDKNKRVWLYFPFKDVAHDPSMPGNEKRYRDKYPNFQRALRRDDSLVDVDNDDMLIIAAHGLPGNNKEIGVSILNPNVSQPERDLRISMLKPAATIFDKIEANDLADLMKTNKLNKGHKRIKFITCGGAGMAVLDVNSVETKPNPISANDITKASFAEVNMTDCFAAVFAKAMRVRDYLHLRVRAYPGFLSAGNLQKLLKIESSDGQGVDMTHEVFVPAGFGLHFPPWKPDRFENVATWGKKVRSVPTSAVAEKFWFDGSGQRVN